MSNDIKNIKPSDLKKDVPIKLKVNQLVLQALTNKGLSLEKAFDIYCDTTLSVTSGDKGKVKVK